MTLIIEAGPELIDRLEAEAKRRGVSASELARTLLEIQMIPDLAPASPSQRRASKPGEGQRTSIEEELPFYARATPEEWDQAFDRWVERHGVRGVSLPSEAMEREAIYGDRG